MTVSILNVGLIVGHLTVASPPIADELHAPDGTRVMRMAANCSSAAAQVVGQTGGQLLSASAKTVGGRTVCVITVLVPGSGNERSRKVTVSVPQ